MKYVYLLQSIDFPEETYVGLTDDLRSRFTLHTMRDGRRIRLSTGHGVWFRMSRFPTSAKPWNSNAI
jgi:predicted GIY-YIG superfamily endonuclease